jgi:predicted branched-subunit amino acid permease
MGFRARPLWLPIVLTSAAASILAERFIGSPWHVSVGAVAGIALAVILTPSDAPAHRIEDAAE